MNKDQIMGIVRHVLTFGGGFLVAKDWLDAGMLETATGAVVALVGVVWSALGKKKAA